MIDRVSPRRALFTLAVLFTARTLALADEPAGSPASEGIVSSDPLFRVQLLDGEVASGRVVRLTADGLLTLDSQPAKSIPLGRVVSLATEGESSPAPPEGGLILFPEGDRLRAIIGVVKDDELEVLPGALGDISTRIPIGSMLGIAFTPPPDRAALAKLTRRLREEPRDSEAIWLANGDRLTGSLLQLGPESLEFQADTGPVTLGRSAIVALEFDQAAVRYPRPEGPFLELTFVDGSRLGVRDATVERGLMTAMTRFGSPLRASLSGIARIVARGDAIRYLADQPPAGSQFVAYLGTHPKVFGQNATWDDQPLRLAGQEYDRGLGTLPRTLLAYRIEPSERRFQALVGLDDRAGELANVVFRVLVDGKERFASPPMTRRSTPIPLNVDVSGGKLLILATEFGERGDVQDSADWVDARLVK